MTRPTRLACGCQHSTTHWLVVCAPCAAEHATIHDYWAAQYRAARDRLDAAQAARNVQP